MVSLLEEFSQSCAVQGSETLRYLQCCNRGVLKVLKIEKYQLCLEKSDFCNDRNLHNGVRFELEWLGISELEMNGISPYECFSMYGVS